MYNPFRKTNALVIEYKLVVIIGTGDFIHPACGQKDGADVIADQFALGFAEETALLHNGFR